MTWRFRIAMVVPALLAAAYGQTASGGGKTEFDAASIHVNPPRTGFHFASDASSGGPGTTDPGMFRCSQCTLATLISKAFDLQSYQFPGRTSLTDNSFDVMATIPAGATQEEFPAMMQNLLKDRFGLTYHYVKKNVRGYHLVLAGKGSKLRESGDNERQSGNSDQYRFGQGGAHSHSGVMILNGSAIYRRDHQTTGDLVRLLSDQLSLPVDDQTGLQGKYDIALTWAGDLAHSASHVEGAWGGGGHADHGGGGSVGSGGSGSQPADTSGPTLFEALQSQLGLKLVPSSQAEIRVFVIDRVQPLPAEN